MIQVEVRLYATLRRYNPEASEGVMLLQMTEGSTVTHLLACLGVPKKEARVFFVNNRQQSNDYLLQNGDRVAVFPLVAGG